MGRLILDLSYPHTKGQELGMGIPLSVNKGINNDLFKTEMTSTGLWLKSMRCGGIGALLSKMDWESAYKHIHVQTSDLKLQVFMFCNKYFVELRLAFGAALSPGLFDWPNWAMTRSSMLLTQIPAQWVQKQLDDLCIATPPSKEDVMVKFVSTHRSICDRVGIRLAPETDKEKAFSCETAGTVLGVKYDTVTWSWNIDSEKLKCILHVLYDMSVSESVTNATALSISGKIVHYAPLFASSKWWKKPLTDLPDQDANKKSLIKITDSVRLCLSWWTMSLNRLRLGNLPIQDPIKQFPCRHIPVYTDASGVHTPSNHLHRGGGVYLENNSLVRITWPSNPVWISHHGKSTTLLESIAALQGLLTAISQFGRKPYVVYCEIAGACYAFRKGSCKCHYTWTILRAMDDVANGTMSMVSIEKTRRCSGFGENVADTLAKGELSVLDRLGVSNPCWSR